jgi:hypothetical protein
MIKVERHLHLPERHEAVQEASRQRRNLVVVEVSAHRTKRHQLCARIPVYYLIPKNITYMARSDVRSLNRPEGKDVIWLLERVLHKQGHCQSVV